MINLEIQIDTFNREGKIVFQDDALQKWKSCNTSERNKILKIAENVIEKHKVNLLTNRETI